MKNSGSRPLLVSSQERVVAFLCGLLDSSAWIAAYTTADTAGASYSSFYYTIAVPCKVAILLIFVRTVRIENARIMWPFAAPIGVVVLASIALGTVTIDGIVQPIGLLASLGMTIAILDGENVFVYMKAFGFSSLVACATFLFQLNFLPLNTAHGVQEVFGRYSFVFGTHPNLGGEILFAGFVAFCLARLKLVSIVALFAFYFLALSLLQSRGALLSLTLLFCMYFYVVEMRRYALGARLVILVAAAFSGCMFCIVKWDSIAQLLLLNDSYRGFGTGYVGRDEHWEYAWEVFLQSPFFGVGFGYFRTGVVTPHDLWLSMLGTMGLMSVFLLVAMFKNCARIYQANSRIFLVLCSFIPMTVLNDRFLNLNPYPFLLYVILFLPRQALLAGARAQAYRTKRFFNLHQQRLRNLRESSRI